VPSAAWCIAFGVESFRALPLERITSSHFRVCYSGANANFKSSSRYAADKYVILLSFFLGGQWDAWISSTPARVRGDRLPQMESIGMRLITTLPSWFEMSAPRHSGKTPVSYDENFKFSWILIYFIIINNFNIFINYNLFSNINNVKKLLI